MAPSVNTQVDRSRQVTVELLATSAGLPWTFEALDRSVKLHPGELVTVRYRVVNTLGRAVTAHAVMNPAPAVANGATEAAVVKRAAALRKRFERLKKEIRDRAEREGLVEKKGGRGNA